jgi:hypothetical protein
MKQVQDSHSYFCNTQRQKQSKYRKSSGDRRGLKTACRMAAKQDLSKEI